MAGELAQAQGLGPRIRQELLVGFVGPVGSGLLAVIDATQEALKPFGFANLEVVKVSESFRQLPGEPWSILPRRNAIAVAERYEQYMGAGDALRARLKRKDAALLPALLAVLQRRAAITGDALGQTPSDNTVYLIDSLKTPQEVAVLRSIYGPRFLVIAAYAPRSSRVSTLQSEISNDSIAHRGDPEAESTAIRIVRRDERGQDEDPYGQNVSGAFPLADLIVETTDPDDMRRQVVRFIDLVFGSLEHSPTKLEQGMYLAASASLRSTAMSRQVGTAIVTADGQVLAIGANEAPKPGGGAYWSDEHPDHRTFVEGKDPSVLMRNRLLANLMLHLRLAGWQMPAEVTANDDQELMVKGALARFREWESEQADLGKPPSILAEDIIEFYREVHSEMLAITDAARRGVALEGAWLFTTTFPCHDCAKHIIASGLDNVVFLEPYPKSLVRELHYNAVRVDGEGAAENPMVNFRTFVGVAPRRYASLFQARRRPFKGTFSRATASMRLVEYEDPGLNIDIGWYDPDASIRREQLILGDLKKTFEERTGEQLT